VSSHFLQTMLNTSEYRGVRFKGHIIVPADRMTESISLTALQAAMDERVVSWVIRCTNEVLRQFVEIRCLWRTPTMLSNCRRCFQRIANMLGGSLQSCCACMDGPETRRWLRTPDSGNVRTFSSSLRIFDTILGALYRPYRRSSPYSNPGRKRRRDDTALSGAAALLFANAPLQAAPALSTVATVSVDEAQPAAAVAPPAVAAVLQAQPAAAVAPQAVAAVLQTQPAAAVAPPVVTSVLQAQPAAAVAPPAVAAVLQTQPAAAVAPPAVAAVLQAQPAAPAAPPAVAAVLQAQPAAPAAPPAVTSVVQAQPAAALSSSSVVIPAWLFHALVNAAASPGTARLD
jgi:hypothetical protein